MWKSHKQTKAYHNDHGCSFNSMWVLNLNLCSPMNPWIPHGPSTQCTLRKEQQTNKGRTQQSWALLHATSFVIWDLTLWIPRGCLSCPKHKAHREKSARWTRAQHTDYELSVIGLFFESEPLLSNEFSDATCVRSTRHTEKRATNEQRYNIMIMNAPLYFTGFWI